LALATTEPGPCQMRSKAESPCLRRAVVEIRGIPLCEGCAREQEAYFAVGELTQETENLRSGPLGKTLGEALDGMRRRCADVLAAPTTTVPRPHSRTGAPAHVGTLQALQHLRSEA
jgi:hypothetical protein